MFLSWVNNKMIQLSAFMLMGCMSASFDGQASVSTIDTSEIVTELSKTIAEHYVEPKKLKEINQRLEKFHTQGQCEHVGSEEAMASELTEALQTVDKHFVIKWQPAGEDKSQKPAKESWFTKLNRQYSGFNKVERLEGNVGYIDFWGFDAVTQTSKQRVRHIMAMVADTDALIIDLRRNGGGSPQMVQLISSYLLDANVHLNSIYWRDTNTTQTFYTLPLGANEKSFTQPVYLLTSANTFSAAEEFVYNLKHLKRATVIGETTKGGANPWRYYPVTDGFKAGIPNAKAINPITQTNWEGVGVKPHLEVDSTQALNVAYRTALLALRDQISHPFQSQDITNKLAELSENAAN